MKLFKQLTLLLTSLLVVTFSFSFTKLSSSSSSLQNKTIEFHLAALAADDIDDDFADSEHEFLFPPLLSCFSLINFDPIEKSSSVFHRGNTPVPFYLQIRNLRI